MLFFVTCALVGIICSDRLYRAKVKHYGLRTGTRRCSNLEVRLACTAGTQKACHGGGARLCGAVPQYPILSIAWQQNWDAEARSRHVCKPQLTTLA